MNIYVSLALAYTSRIISYHKAFFKKKIPFVSFAKDVP